MATVRTEPSRDRQLEEMLADPDAYFRRVRERARAEAPSYVAERQRRLAEQRRSERRAVRRDRLGRIARLFRR